MMFDDGGIRRLDCERPHASELAAFTLEHVCVCVCMCPSAHFSWDLPQLLTR